MTDYLLSQTLSARYYQPDRFPHISEAIGAEPGSDHGQVLEKSSSPEPSQSANRVRKRGRPRISPGNTSPNVLLLLSGGLLVWASANTKVGPSGSDPGCAKDLPTEERSHVSGVEGARVGA